MTFEQYLELVYLDKLYSRKEFIKNRIDVIQDFEHLCHPDYLVDLLTGSTDDLINSFCDKRKMTPQELFQKFVKFSPIAVKMRTFVDLTNEEEALRYSDMNYPTIRAIAVTGRSWVVFISPIDGTLTYF